MNEVDKLKTGERVFLIGAMVVIVGTCAILLTMAWGNSLC